MNKNADTKIVVAMSGGVDSSVSAALLKEAGFNVVGAFMRCWSSSAEGFGGIKNANDFSAGGPARHRYALPARTSRAQADQALAGGCTAEEDEYWARRAAQHLGIPFYSFDLVEEYKRRVVDYFVAEYAAGRTPNPDVLCNSEIKFGVFFDKAVTDLGADYIATGHYARLAGASACFADASARRARQACARTLDERAGNSVTHHAAASLPLTTVRSHNSQHASGALLKGVDANKDQSYFLYRVPQEKLARTMFPIGEYTKPLVRELARRFGLPNAEKKDSQGLCFIGKVDVREFLAEYLPPKPGMVVTTAGKKIGEHEGAQYFTVGQRRGMGIGGGVPYYVVEKDVATNTVVVGTGYDKELYGMSATLEDAVWLTEEPQEGKTYQASIRYRQTPQNVSIVREGKNYVLTFSEPQRAITSGQSAVLYDGDVVVGGGIVA